MPYTRESPTFKVIDLINAIKKRICKYIAKHFPLNKVRIWGLRRCGYKVGRQVYIGEELHVTDQLENIETKLFIGDRVSIAQRVTIILDSDPNWSILAEKIKPVRGVVKIENDAWIGAGVILLPNITVGEQAVVGAGSVVTKNVPAFTVVAGNPAKIIRSIEAE